MATLAQAWDWLSFRRGSNRDTQDHSRFTYSPQLIGELKGDHAELLRRYTAIEALARRGQFASIPAALQGFKAKFDMHVLHENLHFYCYLENLLGKRPADLELIKHFRVEMNAIARGVVNFVRKYHMAGVRPSNGSQFLVELQQVGALLVQRIEREEKDLYTLYRP